MTTSAITFNTIDISFPAAGQDNDSQGFRDNFARIRTALSTAQTEITYLNTYAVDKTKNNDMGANTVSNVLLKGSSLTSITSVASSGSDQSFTFAETHYRRYALGASSNTFKVDYFPLNSYGEVYVELSLPTGETVAKTASFAAGIVNSALGTVTQKVYLGSVGFGSNNYVTVEAGKVVLVKIASPDGGVNTYVNVVETFRVQS